MKGQSASITMTGNVQSCHDQTRRRLIKSFMDAELKAVGNAALIFQWTKNFME
jgi:hypothetical protein